MKLDTLTQKEQIPLQTEELCLKEQPEVCVERSTGYRERIMLPPSSTGYTLTYMRCCRNTSTINIESPENAGNTYLIEIPPSVIANCNSSPVFKNLPPIILCAGYPFEFDHSAIDPDGDELTYKLCTPLDFPEDVYGNAITQNEFGPPPPFEGIVWTNNFGVDNQIGGRPRMKINEQTGLLTASPDRIGRYVIGICVEERRNGELLNTTIRDYQLKIIDCDVVGAEVEANDIDVEGNFIINECEDYTYQFMNLSEGTESFFWNFGDGSVNGADTSILRNPTYQYPDTGKYEVMLIANPNKLCADTAHVILSLYPKMTINFDWEPACAGSNMTFTNKSTTDLGEFTDFSWSFGDSNTSALKNPENIFNLGGNYEVFLKATNSFGCVQEFAKEVYVKPTPDIDFTNTPVCVQQSTNFSDLSEINIGNIVNREWDITDEVGNILFQSNELNIEYTFTNPGNYNVLLTAFGDEDCAETTASSIMVYERIVVDAGLNKNICIGNSVVLSGDVNAPATFLWSADVLALIDNDTLQSPTVTPFENTTVFVWVTDPNGCINSDSLKIILRQLPIVDAGLNDSLCLGDSYNLNGFGQASSNGSISYQWSPNNFIDDMNNQNPMINPQDDITYYLTVTEDEFGCFNTDSIFIKVLKPIDVSTGGGVNTCELEPIQLNVDGGEFYNWQPPTGLDNPTSANPIATISETTNYTVEISNSCFLSEATVLVNVAPAPDVDAGSDVVLDIGDIIQFDAIVENNAEVIKWEPGVDIINGENTTTPELQPLYSRDYVLTATSGVGCSLSDTVSVTVNNIFNLWVPNAFSPNNDGTNDEISIKPKGIKAIDIFKIYNRWGQKVFETNNINQSWDGTFDGRPLEVGVYVYYVIGITYLDELYKDNGNITLIR